jgi:hypothetical protein
MWRKFAKDYLSFTNKDRAGIIVLAILIFIVVLLPYLWPATKMKQPDRRQIEQIKLQAAQLNKKADAPALSSATKESRYQANTFDKGNYTGKKRTLFYFDPNKLDGRKLATAWYWRKNGNNYRKI